MNREVTNGGESGSHIRTFLRIRPSKQPSGYIKVEEHDTTRLSFHVPVETKDGEYVNNTRTTHNFKFDGILGERSTQDDVFIKIGKSAVFNVLDGYNSTVFAYGQTGSGKTFTVTGGAERYVDRGVIPRALSLMFAEFKARRDQQFTCHISYLEIYNEQGFDLLDPGQDSEKQEDLPKVSMMEDGDGNIHLRNLSVCLAANEEEALNYLFLGDTNRAISETAMNKTSSRSHCIFTISVEGRRRGSDKVTRSKLHLVDLAGSERVHKTQTGGQTLVEAKHINVSLFFLEMVIVALHERGTKGRQHIPYRNSMMTSVLRDSLGGNCKTVMIATVNAEAAQTEESISTCRFAQRVSMIKNDARVNEDVDHEVLIRRLRSDCAALTDEVAFLKGEAGEGEELTSEEIEELKKRCRVFVEDPAPTAQLSIGAYTLTKLKRCFAEFKAMVLNGGKGFNRAGSIDGGGGNISQRQYHHPSGERDAEPAEARPGSGRDGDLGRQLLSLRDALQQRDNEIAILVNMLKQGKCHSCAVTAAPETPITTKPSPGKGETGRESREGSGHHFFSGSSDGTAQPQPQPQSRAPWKQSPMGRDLESCPSGSLVAPVIQDEGQEKAATKGTESRRRSVAATTARTSLAVPVPENTSILEDPGKAFAYFREKHPGGAALEENKMLLGEKYARAKVMGERVNQARSTIQYLKSTIEQIRRERALDRLTPDRGSGDDEKMNDPKDDGGEEEDEEEAKCKAVIEVEKKVYRGSFQELRDLKSEIEHIQRLLEKGRRKIQEDFQAWYEPLVDAAEETAANPRARGNPSVRAPVSEGHSTLSNSSLLRGDRRADNRDMRGWSSTNLSERRTESESPTVRPDPPVAAWGNPLPFPEPKSSNKSSKPGGGGFHGDNGGVSLTGIKETDDDIAAFYRAKEELERRRSSGKLQMK